MISPLMFSGYQDFVAKRVELPVGYGNHLLPVAIIPEDSFEYEDRYVPPPFGSPDFEDQQDFGGGARNNIMSQIRFTDGVLAYFKEGEKRPDPDNVSWGYFAEQVEAEEKIDPNHLKFEQNDDEFDQMVPIREVGHSLIAKQLGLSIIPETELAQVSRKPFNSFAPEKYVAESYFDRDEIPDDAVLGNIRDEILGFQTVHHPLYNLPSFKDLPPPIQNHFFELYIHTLVVNDRDKHTNNVEVKMDGLDWAKAIELAVLDNESDGIRVFGSLQDYERLFKPMAGQQIPDCYLQKLRDLIGNFSENQQALTGYFSEDAFPEIRNRAQFLLENPVVFATSELLSAAYESFSQPELSSRPF